MTNIFNTRKFTWNPSKVSLPEGFTKETSPIFNLEIPVSNNWGDRKKRLMIVLEHVDSNDLKAKALCSDFYGTVLSNLLHEAIKYANLTTDAGAVNDYGVAVVNLQSFKSYHLDSRRQAISEKHFLKRVERVMATLEPTHMIVFGDTAAKNLLGLDDYREKRGWVHEYERDWGSFVALSTVDPADLVSTGSFATMDAALDDDSDDEEETDDGGRDLYAKTNLLGHVFRDMSNIFTYGHTEDEHGLVWSAADVHVNARHVLLKSMDKVERMFDLLMDSPRIAYDTELRNLNRIDNKLLTMQFSMDDKTSFILPVRHKDSPFNNKADLERIRELSYGLLCNSNIDPFGDEYLIGTNLQFDMTMTREQLRIPIVTWPLFDIQAGDFIFDENTAEIDNFAGISPKAWSLAAICTRFGSVAYLEKEGFNKADRANMEATSLADKTVVEYMGLDTILPYRICDLQIARAKAIGYKKFVPMVTKVSSSLSHCMSVMEHKGVDIDLPYLESQLKPNSDLYKILDEAKEQMNTSEGAMEANKILAGDRGVDLDGGLFADMGGDEAPDVVQIFNIDKPEHRQILFSDVLGLEPVAGFGKLVRKSNGKPTVKLGKFYQSEHKEVHEVSLYTRINKVSKLISSYIRSFYVKVVESDDGKKDGKLHPSYGFLYVKTGRGNSFKPSLQQTPTRSKEAKFVKRMFAAIFGHLKLKTDYSANEVRFAANLSGDNVMAEPFNMARALRKEMFVADRKGKAERVAELKKELKTKGDIHIQNIYRFFKKWVEKSDPLRDAIKGVVFGVIYGKSAASLGKDLWLQKITDLKDAVFNLKRQIKGEKDDVRDEVRKLAEEAKKSLKEFLAELRKKMDDVQDELEVVVNDKTKMKGRAVEVMEKMEIEWKKLYRWMDRMHQSAAEKLHVEAPHGRRRNLFGMLIPSDEISAALKRRAVNAPVQGFGADVGHVSARLIELALHKFFRKFAKARIKDATTVPGAVECAVHDALLQTPEYKFILPTLQVKHYCMTVGVTDWFAEHFDHKWLSPPEVETEIGMHEANMMTWDFTQEGLRKAVRHGLQDQFDNGLFPKNVTVEEMEEEVFDIPQEWTDYLDEHFPWFATPKHMETA